MSPWIIVASRAILGAAHSVWGTCFKRNTAKCGTTKGKEREAAEEMEGGRQRRERKRQDDGGQRRLAAKEILQEARFRVWRK